MYLYCSYMAQKQYLLNILSIFLLINMSYLYQKLCLQTPKSYQELTRNRPTKKRNYNYTINAQDYQEIVSIPLTNVQGTSKKCLNLNEIIQSQLESKLREKYKDHQGCSKKIQRKAILQFNNQQIGHKFISERSENQKLQSQKSKYIGKSVVQNNKIEDNSLIQQDQSFKQPHFSSFKNNRNVTQTHQSNYLSTLSHKYYAEETTNKNVERKENQTSITQEIVKNKQNKQSITNLQEYNSKVTLEKNKKQGTQPLVQKAFKKVQYYYGQKQIDKDKIRQEIQKNYQEAIKKQKIFSKQAQLDIQIEQIKKKILDNSPLMMPVGITNLQLMESSFNPQICKMSDCLSKLIEMDINLLKLRQVFESQKCEEKWQNLRRQLQTKNLHFQINELKDQISVSFYQKDPFGFKTVDKKNNKVQELATLYAECSRIWFQQIEKCAQLKKIMAGGSQTSLQDLQNKRNINLQDIVCFVNVNSQKLYRSRDVFCLFRRFLKLQGKKIEKKLSLSTIKYQTFIDKLAK